MGVKLTQEFIDGARKTEELYGIPASITLAQLIEESGGKYEGGLSGLAYFAKNLFGIKGTGTAGSYFALTSEFVDGNKVMVHAPFRKYNSYEESIIDHGKLLTGTRYTKQFAGATTVEDYATGLQKAGYATNPNYATNLMKIIRDNNLTQYDKGDYKYSYKGGSQSTVHTNNGNTHGGGGASFGNTSTDKKNNSSNIKLSLIGNIVNIVFIILLIMTGALFFLLALDVKAPKIV